MDFVAPGNRNGFGSIDKRVIVRRYRMDIYEIKSMKDRIAGNPYVGRGIVLGKSEDGNHAVAA